MKTILALFALFAFAGNVFGSELSSLDEQLIQKSSDGDLEAVADLLESGADVNATNRQLETPLSVAAEANHKKNRGTFGGKWREPYRGRSRRKRGAGRLY